MTVFAVIPVKTLIKTKTRLSEILEPQERQNLTLNMLEDVLKAVKSSFIHQIVIVSPNQKIESLTKNYHVTYLPEKSKGLNRAVELAIQWCTNNDAKSVLVLPADIPLITSKDINKIVNLGSENRNIVITPSQDGGTNALLQKPPGLIPTLFGSKSFSRYLKETLKRGINIKVYVSQRVSMDIDSIEDLINLIKVEANTLTHNFLKQIQLNKRFEKNAVARIERKI